MFRQVVGDRQPGVATGVFEPKAGIIDHETIPPIDAPDLSIFPGGYQFPIPQSQPYSLPPGMSRAFICLKNLQIGKYK